MNYSREECISVEINLPQTFYITTPRSLIDSLTSHDKWKIKDILFYFLMKNEEQYFSLFPEKRSIMSHYLLKNKRY